MIPVAVKEQGNQEIFRASNIILDANFLSFGNVLVNFKTIYTFDLSIVSHVLKLMNHCELINKTLRYYCVQLLIHSASHFAAICIFISFSYKRRLF